MFSSGFTLDLEEDLIEEQKREEREESVLQENLVDIEKLSRRTSSGIYDNNHYLVLIDCIKQNVESIKGKGKLDKELKKQIDKKIQLLIDYVRNQ